jgi:hypothetical protein
VLPYQFEPEASANASNIRAMKATANKEVICLCLTRKSIMSRKAQNLGAFKILVGVNLIVALLSQQRLLNGFCHEKALQYKDI